MLTRTSLHRSMLMPTVVPPATAPFLPPTTIQITRQQVLELEVVLPMATLLPKTTRIAAKSKSRCLFGLSLRVFLCLVSYSRINNISRRVLCLYPPRSFLHSPHRCGDIVSWYASPADVLFMYHEWLCNCGATETEAMISLAACLILSRRRRLSPCFVLSIMCFSCCYTEACSLSCY